MSFTILSLIFTLLQVCHTFKDKPDSILEVPELIKKHGYPLEIYPNITTEDGYLLDIFRIPRGKGDDGIGRRTNKTVLLMHGLLGNAGDFFFSPNRSLAYILADYGFDVWLGNARGTKYSYKHLFFDPILEASKFWNFSWHEIGTRDLPAIISFITKTTKKSKISYVGFSQGTTLFFVMASEKPEFNEKISVMTALAPVAYMSRLFSPLARIMANFESLINMVSKVSGIYEMPPKLATDTLNKFLPMFCEEGRPTIEICTRIFFLLGGYSPFQFDRTSLPIMVSHFFDGASIYQHLHYAQLIKSGHFRRYDFGKATNLLKYGEANPPRYNLSKIIVPVALFHSADDWFTHPADIEKLHGQLGNPIGKFDISSWMFNHFDFLNAVDVVNLVYKDVLKILDTYS